MSILRKLKSIIGVDDADDESDRDVTVTVEHDPENEATVKGADVGESTTDDGSHAVAVSESESDGDDESAGASTEPAGDGTHEQASAAAADSPDGNGASGEEATDAAPDEVEIRDAEDAEDGDTDGTDPSASGERVDVLNGIGPAYAERLGDAGIETVGELADADAAALAADTEIAEGRIQGWIDQAAEY